MWKITPQTTPPLRNFIFSNKFQISEFETRDEDLASIGRKSRFEKSSTKINFQENATIPSVFHYTIR